ncbi:MAG: FeoA family protein [Alphaproteobacteria bacterium]
MSLAIEHPGVRAAPLEDPPSRIPLCEMRPGVRGRIAEIRIPANGSFGVAAEELERRLLEIGFTEGASIEVLHEGLFGRDPIVALVDGTRIALRRREAQVILIAMDGAPARNLT